MNDTGSPSSPDKSTFITILAWVSIVLAGSVTFVSILQNIMLNLMFPIEGMKESLNSPGAQENIPAFAEFILSNVRLFFFGFLVVSSTTLASAIGLLKRKNWARILFIIILVLGIIWNISAVIMQQFMIPSMQDVPDDSQFAVLMIAMRIFTLIMALGISLLFGWLIKKLLSSEIRGEFLPRAT